MKFMQKFKTLFFLFLISFLGQSFIFQPIFAMEVGDDGLNQSYEEDLFKDFNENIEKFYRIAKKGLISSQEHLFLHACAQAQDEDDDTFLTRLINMQINGSRERLEKKAFIFIKLLEYGADPEVQDGCRNTILHAFAMRDTPSKEMFPHKRRCLNIGGFAKSPSQYYDGETFDYEKERRIISPLKKFVRLSYPNENMLQHLLNRTNNRGATPLLVAVSLANSNTGFIESLLDLGADPKIQDYRWNTVLHRLVFNRMASEEIKIENLRLFIKSKNLASIKNCEGKTAIQCLLEKESKEIREGKRSQYSEFYKMLGRMDLRLIPEHLHCIFE